LTYFLHRWAIGLLLLTATYNPTGWCYIVWVNRNPDLPASIVLLFGLVITFGFVVYVRGAFGAIGIFGVLALSAFCGTALWALSDLKFIDLKNPVSADWAILFVLSLIFSLGMSWSHLRRLRISGRIKKHGNSDW